MKRSTAAIWWTSFSYLLGAVLFLVGAARFLVHDDSMGATIYGAAALLALWQAITSYRQTKGKAC